MEEWFAIPCIREENKWETFPSELPWYELWDQDFEVNISVSNKTLKDDDGKWRESKPEEMEKVVMRMHFSLH